MVLAAALCGCEHHVFSPPARALPLESVAPVGRGRTGIQLEGSQHGAMFGPDISAGALRARRGVTRALDLSLETTWFHLQGDSASGENQNAQAHRLGAHLAPLRFVAVNGGLGGGFSAAGPFVSPDVGVTFAWENGYVVPFWGLRGLFSLPIDARTVDTSQAGTAPGSHRDAPELTWGVGSTMGLRVPLPFGTPALEPGELSGSLLVGWSFTSLRDSEDHEEFGGIGGGAEIAF